jgi:hypothetical protein
MIVSKNATIGIITNKGCPSLMPIGKVKNARMNNIMPVME